MVDYYLRKNILPKDYKDNNKISVKIYEDEKAKNKKPITMEMIG